MKTTPRDEEKLMTITPETEQVEKDELYGQEGKTRNL